MSKNSSKIKDTFTKVQDFFISKGQGRNIKEAIPPAQFLELQEKHKLVHSTILKIIMHPSSSQDIDDIHKGELEKLQIYQESLGQTIECLNAISQELSETSLGVEVYLGLREDNDEVLHNFQELFDRDLDCQLYKKIEFTLKDLNDAYYLVVDLIGAIDDN